MVSVVSGLVLVAYHPWKATILGNVSYFLCRHTLQGRSPSPTTNGKIINSQVRAGIGDLLVCHPSTQHKLETFPSPNSKLLRVLAEFMDFEVLQCGGAHQRQREDPFAWNALLASAGRRTKQKNLESSKNWMKYKMERVWKRCVWMFVMHNLKKIKMFGRKYIESNTIRIVVLHHLVDLMMFRSVFPR